jgi:hypothetical protein
MITLRSKAAVLAQDHNYIYLIGGYNMNALDTIERYDINNNCFSMLFYNLKLITPLFSCLALFVADYTILIAGGYYEPNKYSNEVYLMNLINTPNYTSLDSLPSSPYKLDNYLPVYYNDNDLLEIFFLNEKDYLPSTFGYKLKF